MNLSEHTALEFVDKAASHFAITLAFAEDLRVSRTHEAALRRAEVQHVLHLFGMGYNEIGRLFGCDHTTVMAACQRVEERLTTHVGYREQIEALVNLARGVMVLTQQRERMQEKVKAGRERLADERTGYTHHFTVIARVLDSPDDKPETYEVDGYLTTGTYPDGKRLGEIFLKVGKHGGEQAVYDAWATAASIALQLGASVDNLFSKWVGISFEPSGATTNKDIPRCVSILDYCAKYLIGKFGSK